MCALSSPKVSPPPPPPQELLDQREKEAQAADEQRRKLLALAQGRSALNNPGTGSLGVVNPYSGANSKSLF